MVNIPNFRSLRIQMKKIRKFNIALIAAFILMNTHDADADKVRLKNGGVMEGIIQTDSEEEIVLDVGFGTVTIEMDEVEGIERGAKEDQKKILEQWQVGRG